MTELLVLTKSLEGFDPNALAHEAWFIEHAFDGWPGRRAMSSSTFLVSGATGNQGGSVARELLKAGHRVRALVRDPSKPQAKELESLGAVLFLGDYDDADTIHKATAGVQGVFFVPIPSLMGPDAEARLARHVQLFVDAARAAGTVDTFVVSTTLKADRWAVWAEAHPDHALAAYGRTKFLVEETVRASGIKHWTILRPPWLFQNLIYPQSNSHFPELSAAGVVRTALDLDFAIAQLDARDIGRWAAAAFADPVRFHGKTLDLAAYNHTLRESLRELSVAAGVEIPIESVSTQELERDTTNPHSVVRATLAKTLNGNSDLMTLTEKELDEVKSYGVPFTTWSEYLAENKAKVTETVKNVKVKTV